MYLAIVLTTVLTIPTTLVRKATGAYAAPTVPAIGNALKNPLRAPNEADLPPLDIAHVSR